MRLNPIAAGLGVSVLLAACGDEGPVALDGLVPDAVVSTFDVVLDDVAFLEFDTTMTGFHTPGTKGALVFAENVGGELNAHALVRFERPPTQVSYTNADGDSRTDTIPTPLGGELTLVLDRSQTSTKDDFDFEIRHVPEGWDATTANWEMRVDSVGERLAWTQPGGTVGGLIAQTTWPAGTDTLRLPFDSAMHAQWMQGGAVRGIRIASRTPGVRGRLSSVALTLEYRPTPRPDTVVTVSLPIMDRTSIVDRAADPDGDLLVGGIPGWRAFLGLKSRLDTVQVPCAGPATGCTVALGETTISYAAIVLETTEPPAGYAALDSIQMNAYPVLGTDELPLGRAPLGNVLTNGPVTASVHHETVEIPVTSNIAWLASPDRGGTASDRPWIIALLPSPEGERFGLVSFADSSDGDRAPRLRIVYSVTHEAQLP